LADRNRQADSDVLTEPKVVAGLIRKVDAIGIPSSDTERSREFYVETLGLRPDESSRLEFWIDRTCFEIWEPGWHGLEFKPQATSIALLHVDDVDAARAELEAKGVRFDGETRDTGVCHMAHFTDPDGNPLTLHKRYAPYVDDAS
jgi:catechol 2,3-dioxygenase-like lactoylglutathione lyase family enzyme